MSLVAISLLAVPNVVATATRSLLHFHVVAVYFYTFNNGELCPVFFKTILKPMKKYIYSTFTIKRLEVYILAIRKNLVVVFSMLIYTLSVLPIRTCSKRLVSIKLRYKMLAETLGVNIRKYTYKVFIFCVHLNVGPEIQATNVCRVPLITGVT